MSTRAKEAKFGRYLLELRTRREFTQEVLAIRTSLSADTIRRLESGSFSPSMDTLRKLCSGLDLNLSTLFLGYELRPQSQLARELFDLISSQPPDAQALALSVLEELFGLVDRRADAR